jgi:hypothetical protein
VHPINISGNRVRVHGHQRRSRPRGY